MISAVPVPFEGGCLCGRLRYRGGSPPFVAYTCHCQACQKLTASAFATCMQVPAESVALLSGEAAQRERIADSGNRLTINFCRDCGSVLWTQNAARPRLRTIYLGTLDAPELIPVAAHIWTKRRLPWIPIPEGHRVFLEAGDWRSDYASDPSRLSR
jgi:hypothetical protein